MTNIYKRNKLIEIISGILIFSDYSVRENKDFHEILNKLGNINKQFSDEEDSRIISKNLKLLEMDVIAFKLTI